jgi:chaperonin GroES
MWQPLNDRILVRRISEPNASRIITPEKYRQATHTGIVVAVGPGKRDEDGDRVPLDVEIGDIVTFGRFTDWDVDDTVLIQEADVMFTAPRAMKIDIDAFTHNEVGVDRFAGSLEERYEKTMHG